MKAFYLISNHFPDKKKTFQTLSIFYFPLRGNMGQLRQYGTIQAMMVNIMYLCRKSNVVTSVLGNIEFQGFPVERICVQCCHLSGPLSNTISSQVEPIMQGPT
uniref:Uncharacterized protein n=1 Tax=Cacopsylla melanoneura TaxID=428564 RepID=A0A8D8VT71_9HEMI